MRTIMIAVMGMILAFPAMVSAQLPPGKQAPHAAFAAPANHYLLIYMDAIDVGEVHARGQFLMGDAAAEGAEISISINPDSTNPNIAYDTANNDYLTTWNQNNGTDLDIYGQLVGDDGALLGANFLISDATTGDQWRSTIAYDAVNGRFFVVWNDDRTGVNHIYGQLVNADGALEGANIAIFDGADVGFSFPAVAFGGGNQRFLVCWSDSSSGAGADIFGQSVNADGSLNGTPFSISSPAEPFDQVMPSIAYNADTDQYLVVWYDLRDGATYNIYGQLVNADGSLAGTNIQITADTTHNLIPSVAYDNVNNRFFVIWNHDTVATDTFVYGQFVNPDGSLEGSAFQVSTDTSIGSRPAVAFNNLCTNYLVTHVTSPAPGEPVELRNLIVGDPCETTPPTVTGQSPAAGAADVPIDTVVTATFSEKMRASTFTADSFYLDNGVVGTVTYDEETRTATLTPSENLAPNTTYVATVTTAVKDLVGNALTGNVGWSFITTGAGSGGGCSLMPRSVRKQ